MLLQTLRQTHARQGDALKSTHTGNTRICFCLLLILLLGACAGGPPGMIRDLVELPQDAGHYLQDTPPRFIAPAQQAERYKDFRGHFFAPWHRDSPRHTARQVFSGFQRYAARPLYGETNLPLPLDWIEAMARRAHRSAYPCLHRPAIAVVHASMRVFPTHKPVFDNPAMPGRGFPFDRMQNSLVPAGTPLLVTHESRDGQWALVETDWAAGWVRWPEIALVDEEFIAAYTAAALAGFWADDVPVTGLDGRFLVSGRVGMALPLAPEQEAVDGCKLQVPVRDHLGRARLIKATAPKKAVHPLPFPATRENAARLLNALMGKNYGWGGLYENRDCSALIQDVMAAFGRWLPRNSRDQAAAGRWISFQGLNRRQRERLIRETGKPLLTLFYMPGHVMLYIGQDPGTGRSVVCHAMWGIRTVRLFEKGAGRWVIGKTVVTSLGPGREFFPYGWPGRLLIDKLTGMARLDGGHAGDCHKGETS
ncbi:MAG: NlpC/P60 family N-terminal domain-containing protein [Desulfobacterales bacterium]|nr:NlpC/P60 family N-terminal domain-containing protein [Desulfobacteraceae bacterium]MDY0312159.1 NlpC/P60 family N-terminal domain-containing protein [Desulfobacterales bacterium]